MRGSENDKMSWEMMIYVGIDKGNLAFSWWYHWGKYDEIWKENTWDNSRGWVDLFMEFDPKVIYSFGMFMIMLIVANIYYILWWLYGYSWIEFVIENEFKVILLKGLVPRNGILNIDTWKSNRECFYDNHIVIIWYVWI